jgi:tRNA-2-methylthio-N6-dimethylallyladenosine synthase
VGFPGERDRDFADTLDLVMRVGYASAFSFAYSARPGTPASGLKTQVEEALKEERLQRLQEALRQQQLHFNQSKVGETLPVLLEKKGKKPGQLLGKSPFLQSALVMAPDTLLGQLVNLKIESAHPNSITGIMAQETERTPLAS